MVIFKVRNDICAVKKSGISMQLYGNYIKKQSSIFTGTKLGAVANVRAFYGMNLAFGLY